MLSVLAVGRRADVVVRVQRNITVTVSGCTELLPDVNCNCNRNVTVSKILFTTQTTHSCLVGVSFRSKVGQIGTKWDKSGTF